MESRGTCVRSYEKHLEFLELGLVREAFRNQTLGNDETRIATSHQKPITCHVSAEESRIRVYT